MREIECRGSSIFSLSLRNKLPLGSSHNNNLVLVDCEQELRIPIFPHERTHQLTKNLAGGLLVRGPHGRGRLPETDHTRGNMKLCPPERTSRPGWRERENKDTSNRF